MSECIVCGKTKHRHLYSGVVQCLNCGHVFSNMELTDNELREIYQKDYFFGDEYSDYIADKQTIQKNLRKRLEVLMKFADVTHHRHVLEIGCAYGFFLELAKDHFDIAVGLDISEDGVRYARDVLGVTAYQADLLQYDFSDQMFDVVCMWDTIEHIRDPHRYIEKISSIVPSGGLFALTTGDIDSLMARLQRNRWRLIHPPTHIHYFSKRTLTRLLRKHAFEPIYNHYCGFFRSIDNVAYNLFVLRQKRPALYELIRRTGLGRFDFYLNLYDIMFVIARKQ